jgi:hypothetical protein
MTYRIKVLSVCVVGALVGFVLGWVLYPLMLELVTGDLFSQIQVHSVVEPLMHRFTMGASWGLLGLVVGGLFCFTCNLSVNPSIKKVLILIYVGLTAVFLGLGALGVALEIEHLFELSQLDASLAGIQLNQVSLYWTGLLPVLFLIPTGLFLELFVNRFFR